MSNKIFCQNCKAELSEGTAFCPACGTKNEVITPNAGTVFCSECGAGTSSAFAFCQECGKPLVQNVAPVTPTAPATPPMAQATPPMAPATPPMAPTTPPMAPATAAVGNVPKKKAFKVNELLKKPIYIAIPAVILVLIIAIALVLKLKPSSSSSLIYAKDKELQFSYLSNQKTFELTDRLVDGSGYFDTYDFMGLSSYIFMSDDERYIFYPDRFDGNQMTYYWRDLKSDISKSDASIKIDSEISLYPVISADGSRFFYTKGDDYRLYLFDRKSDEKVKIDDEVRSFYVSDSGNYIIYSKLMDGEYSIYEMSIKGTSGEKNKLDSNSRIRSVYPNEKKVFYVKEDSLYMVESGQNKVKITSEFESIFSIVDKNSVYYTKAEEVVNKLSNYINDDMLAADKEISDVLPSPSYSEAPSYPSEYEYQIETWVDSWWGNYRHPETNEWGYWEYTTDQEAYGAAVEEYERKYSIWEEEVERYNTEYNEAYQKLRDKEYRDELRLAFDSEDNAIKYNEYSLYYWNNGTETLISSDVDSYQLSSSSLVSAVIYQKYNKSSISSQKMSELISNDDNYYSMYDYIYDLQEKILASRNLSDDIYLALGEKETTVDCFKARNWTINKRGAIYFLDDYNEEKGYGSLMSAAVKNGALEKPVKVDDDVSGYRFGNDTDSVYYYKDVKNGSGDIYLNGKLIASDVYLSSLYNYKGTNKLIYFTDYSDRSQSGTLCLYDNGIETKISDDVSFFVAINEKNIAYLMDYRMEREKGDLMLYNGKKKPIPIDTDVTALLWNPNMMWGAYWNYYY